MNEQTQTPRLVAGAAMRIAGLSRRYSGGNVAGIPDQWKEFGPWIGAVPGQVGWTTYGLCHGAGESMDYVCGMEVSAEALLPEGLIEFLIPAQNYAVFTHSGHISGIGTTWDAIFSRWLPASGMKMTRGAQLEVYDERWDGMTGVGEVEIRIPVGD